MQCGSPDWASELDVHVSGTAVLGKKSAWGSGSLGSDNVVSTVEIVKYLLRLLEVIKVV